MVNLGLEGVLLASAYPDRIARLRPGGDTAHYHLSNGRSARIPKDDPLAGREWLAVAELGGHVGESADRIYSATALDPANFREILSTLVSEQEQVEWDYRTEQFVAQRRRLVGNILLGTEPQENVSELCWVYCASGDWASCRGTKPWNSGAPGSGCCTGYPRVGLRHAGRT